MKRVTIDAPSPECSRPATPIRDAPYSHGLPIPKHMIAPGREGYRTPTIEDYEEAKRLSPEKHGTIHSANNSFLRLPGLAHPGFYLGSARSSTTSLSERLLEKLQWRQRIRHFTWTFFTLTMATGGIANVLHAVPFRFSGLYAIGVVFFLLNILLFIVNIVMITTRFVLQYVRPLRAALSANID